MPLPFLLVSSAPSQPTGTSRIATDLMARLWARREALDLDLLHVGSVDWGPLPAAGVPIAHPVPWPCHTWTEDRVGGIGPVIEQALRRYPKDTTGVVWIIGDPGRAFEAMAPFVRKRPGWKLWGYLPVDAENVNGSLGGPAARAVSTLDRVLACAPYGQGVLRTLRPDVEMIPMGIDPILFQPIRTDAEMATAQRYLDPGGSGQMVLGCVASNQARKDWGLFFATLKTLRARGHKIRGWAHIDRQVGEAWSLPQLAEDFGFDWQALSVTERLADRELAICYAGCVATLAIGRGEGFGYPIAESRLCGTPVAHADYGGGADLVPGHWQIPVDAYHLVGPYALKRPVVSDVDAADVIEAIIEAGHAGRMTAPVPHLTWEYVWPRFEAWIAAGLETR